MNQYINQIKKWIKNKYLVIGLLYFIIICIICYIFYYIFSLFTYKEGFIQKKTINNNDTNNNDTNNNDTNNNNKKNKGWSPKIIKQFLLFEKTVNPNFNFDIKIIQKQATQDEVEFLLETGKWKWSDDIKQIYQNMIMYDTIRQINPIDAMNIDQSIYNETAIKELLGWKAPEGQFLLNGILIESNDGKGDIARQQSGEGDFGIDSGLITINKDLIRCNENKSIQKIIWDGYDGITGLHKKKIVDLDYNNLPKIIPGFSFIKESCNPCIALSNPPNYTCPFVIKRESDNENYNNNGKIVSNIWRNLWGLGKKYAGYQEPKITSQIVYRINH